MFSKEDQDEVVSRQYDEKCKQSKHRGQPRRLLKGYQRNSIYGASELHTRRQQREVTSGQRLLDDGNPRGRKLIQSHESHKRSRFVSSASSREAENSTEIKPSSCDSPASIAVHDYTVGNITKRFDLDVIASNTNTEAPIFDFYKPDGNVSILRAPTFAHHNIARASAEGNFVHHRDTFALARKSRNQKHQNRSKIPPQPIIFNMLQFIDHQTYLSMRLLSRSWNKVVDRAKPPHFPPVYRLPSEIILNIYVHLLRKEGSKASVFSASVNDFNNARHTCRAWMAASLDGRFLTWVFLQFGWRNTLLKYIPELMDQTEVREDNPEILWRMSLLLARECRLLSRKTSMGVDHVVSIDR